MTLDKYGYFKRELVHQEGSAAEPWKVMALEARFLPNIGRRPAVMPDTPELQTEAEGREMDIKRRKATVTEEGRCPGRRDAIKSCTLKGILRAVPISSTEDCLLEADPTLGVQHFTKAQ